ncbi:hypothetical protein [Curtobacterium sp. MCBD17_040]|uniref:hypothetical protein n=1 Tax=Curtobacterium sp. MCBD17_040 TaxID=2175674 RepID=UPI000DA7CF4A|nr:hypothetical protein [Curtobacterium sp. MCBD17_040]WIB63586.1 hypothetical protein DEI94_15780 [Curtobacterium sp. MCBD17_040]
MTTIQRTMLALSISGVAAIAGIAGSAMTTAPAASAAEQAEQSPSAVTQGIQQLRELGVRNISVVDASTGQVVSRETSSEFVYPGP